MIEASLECLDAIRESAHQQAAELDRLAELERRQGTGAERDSEMIELKKETEPSRRLAPRLTEISSTMCLPPDTP